MQGNLGAQVGLQIIKEMERNITADVFSARVVDSWNELDDSTVSVYDVTAFKRKLGKLGY